MVEKKLTWVEMIISAVENVAEKRKGASLPAIKKFIGTEFTKEFTNNKGNLFLLRSGINSALNSEKIVMVKGRGINGHFKLGESLKKIKKSSPKPKTTLEKQKIKKVSVKKPKVKKVSVKKPEKKTRTKKASPKSPKSKSKAVKKTK